MSILAFVFAEKQIDHLYHFNDRYVVWVGSLVHWVIGASLIWVALDLTLWVWGGYVGAYAFMILLLRVRDPMTRTELKRPKRVFFRHAEIDALALGLFHAMVMRYVI